MQLNMAIPLNCIYFFIFTIPTETRHLTVSGNNLVSSPQPVYSIVISSRSPCQEIEWISPSELWPVSSRLM